MKKQLSAVFAIALFSGLATAQDGPTHWNELDRELGRATALGTAGWAQDGPLVLDGFVRTRFAQSNDVEIASVDGPGGTNELSGFQIDNARLEARAKVGELGFVISLEGSSGAPDTPATYGSGGGSWAMFGDVETTGAMNVLDANATWQFSEQVGLTAGLFLVPFESNSAIREDRMLFLNHTVSGEHWRFRDTGVMFSGRHERFGWQAALTNGLDEQGDNMAMFARVSAQLLDQGGPLSEGSYGVGDARYWEVALGYYSDDDNTDDDEAWTLGSSYAQGQFSGALEVVDYGDGATSIYTNNVQSQTVIAGDRTAWALQAGWLFAPEWETAARYEDLDDTDNTTVTTFGINRYLSGHAAKLQLNYSMAASDDAQLEANILSLGMTVSI